jgi:hypothetical protein
LEDVGEAKLIPAAWPEFWMSIACDLIPLTWLSVPAAVLGSGAVSQGVAIVLFIFFVLSAALFSRFWYAESQQQGLMITVAYAALLSAVIFR